MITNKDSDTDPYQPTHVHGGRSDQSYDEENHNQVIADKKVDPPETFFLEHK